MAKSYQLLTLVILTEAAQRIQIDVCLDEDSSVWQQRDQMMELKAAHFEQKLPKSNHCTFVLMFFKKVYKDAQKLATFAINFFTETLKIAYSLVTLFG